MSGLRLQGEADYRRFLEVQVSGVLPLEGGLRRGDYRGLPGVDERLCAPDLFLDTKGFRHDANGDGDVEARSVNEVLGYAYVLEGSRLGGSVLLERAM